MTVRKNPRKGPNSRTRRTATPYQFQVTSTKRTSPMVPNMELPSGNECTTRPRRCCRTRANPSMVVTKPFRKDGARMTKTTSLCQMLGGTEKQIIQYDELALEDHSHIATRKERSRNEKHWVLSLNKEGVQGPLNQRLDFVEAKRELKGL